MRGLPAGPNRLTSRFDMDEDDVDYAELTDSWLDPDTSGWIFINSGPIPNQSV